MGRGMHRLGRLLYLFDLEGFLASQNNHLLMTCLHWLEWLASNLELRAAHSHSPSRVWAQPRTVQASPHRSAVYSVNDRFLQDGRAATASAVQILRTRLPASCQAA